MLRYTRLGSILAISGMFIAGCGGSTDSNAVNITPSTSTTDTDNTVSQSGSMYDIPQLDDATIQRYLDAINSYRTAEGGQDCGDKGHFDPVPALVWSDALYRAAYEHTYDMVMNDFVSHDGSGTEYDWTASVNDLDYSTVVNRVEQNGYTGWRAVGENIAAGTYTDTPQKAVAQLMDSPGHCANIMSPDFHEVGMAHIYKDDTTYKHYWTQNFGTLKSD